MPPIISSKDTQQISPYVVAIILVFAMIFISFLIYMRTKEDIVKIKGTVGLLSKLEDKF